jgi:hypothetical protein
MSQYRVGNNDTVCHIEHSLLGDVLGEDGSLDVSVVDILNRPRLLELC